jgi:hypothetical protein
MCSVALLWSERREKVKREYVSKITFPMAYIQSDIRKYYEGEKEGDEL